MTGPNFTGGQFPPPGSVPPGGSSTPGDDGARRKRRLLVGGVLVLVLIGLGIANLAGAFDSSAPGGTELNRNDPASTATVFVERYAVHDPAVCELVTTDLATKFQRDGRCTGAATGAVPRVDVLVSRTCGNRHLFSAEVNPAGAIGQRFVMFGLEQAGNQEWAVRSVLPISDRNVIRDDGCAAPSTSYEG